MKMNDSQSTDHQQMLTQYNVTSDILSKLNTKKSQLLHESSFKSNLYKKTYIPKFENMSTKIELGIAPLLSLYTHTRKNAI